MRRNPTPANTVPSTAEPNSAAAAVKWGTGQVRSKLATTGMARPVTVSSRAAIRPGRFSMRPCSPRANSVMRGPAVASAATNP